MKLRMLLALIVGALSTSTNAAMVISATTSITDLYSYKDDGSMLIKVLDPPIGCDGFWLPNNEEGYELLVATLFVAYSEQVPVILYGDDTDLSPASSNSYCHLRIVRLRPHS